MPIHRPSGGHAARRGRGRPQHKRTAPAVIGLAVAIALLDTVVGVGSRADAARPSGPTLTVSASQAATALRCTGDLRKSKLRPVLFIHGTTSDSQANWSWNWARAFDARRWAHCELDLPSNGTDDIQVGAEYVTRAIRAMHRAAGRRISIVGHSQGGMIARWTLKYWPDTRAMVDDYVGLAASNHGSAMFELQCGLTRTCPAANWQQARGSRFLAALNAGRETYPGISYTEISTAYDEIVNPANSPFLSGDPTMVTNVRAQRVCPLEVVEHFGMAYSNAAWLIGLDALTHAGPARIGRVPRTTCGAPYMPGVDGARFALDVVNAVAVTAQSTLTAKNLSSEPALKAYAR